MYGVDNMGLHLYHGFRDHANPTGFNSHGFRWVNHGFFLNLTWLKEWVASAWGKAMGKIRCGSLMRVICGGLGDESVGRGNRFFSVVPRMEMGGWCSGGGVGKRKGYVEGGKDTGCSGG